MHVPPRVRSPRGRLGRVLAVGLVIASSSGLPAAGRAEMELAPPPAADFEASSPELAPPPEADGEAASPEIEEPEAADFEEASPEVEEDDAADLEESSPELDDGADLE